MLNDVKLALRKTTNDFDGEIRDLISAALEDLRVAGISDDVLVTQDPRPLIKRAVITYCKANFGQSDDYDRLKKSYDEQKAQLSTNSEYNGNFGR